MALVFSLITVSQTAEASLATYTITLTTETAVECLGSVDPFSPNVACFSYTLPPQVGRIVIDESQVNQGVALFDLIDFNLGLWGWNLNCFPDLDRRQDCLSVKGGGFSVFLTPNGSGSSISGSIVDETVLGDGPKIAFDGPLDSGGPGYGWESLFDTAPFFDVGPGEYVLVGQACCSLIWWNTGTYTIARVPEVATGALLALGIGALLAVRRQLVRVAS